MVDPQPFKADPGSKGVYGVNESGVEFAYGDKEPDFATTPEDFLDQFRYVECMLCLVWFRLPYTLSCTERPARSSEVSPTKPLSSEK
jgi:hypothetical protein